MTAELVLRDPLTGAHSRATLQDRLREEVERARRYALPLSLLILDLDHFKTVNDAFGHTRGDLILTAFVERVRGLARDSDLLFRYGGDEFVLLLLHTDREQALAFAGRLLEGIRSGPFPGTPPLTLTLSIGSASFPGDGQTAEDLFERADRRLYDAKHHGRGRVIADDPVSPDRLTFETASRMMDRELPLVKLKQFLDDLPQQKRGTFVITGPSGVGKTWFLAELAKSARLRGYAVWSIRARSALRSRVFGALAESQPPVEGLPPPAAGEQVFVRALHTVLQDQAKAGLILAVDNLAELDRASFDLLWRILFAPELGVVALAHTVQPDSPNRAPPFDAPLQAQVELRPFSALGVRLWLRSVMRWEAPEGVAGWLHRETGGLPGHLERALAYLMDHELLRAQEAGWSLAKSAQDLKLTDTLQQLARPAPHNLPVAATSFVGREAEVAALKHRLVTEPLITIVAPGGMGKTRLALQAAAESRDHFSSGVFFVSLSSVTVVDDLISNMAQAMSITLAGTTDARQQLLSHLTGREMLLVLDDVEYLLTAAELVAEIREQAPRVKILVTSRERLNLPDESVFELRGFPLPPSSAGQGRRGRRTSGDYSAEQLFVHSARRVMPDFALADEDRMYVRRICELVEGLPLGIELAAAWTPLFTCHEIAEQIERSLDFLATERQETPARQRSARAVLDYFWGLLADDERRRVRRLSVFRGGFTLEAAQQTAGASLFFLSALVDKAFLRKAPSGRYEMQELLRQYAESKLQEASDELQSAANSHCEFFSEFLARQLEPLRGGRQSETLAAVAADLANVRAAWRWAASHGRAADMQRSTECLVLFYQMQSWFHEGAETFARAAEAWRNGLDEAVTDLSLRREAQLVQARLLAAQAAFLHHLGLNARANEIFQEAHDILRSARALEGGAAAAAVLLGLGVVHLDLAVYPSARDWLNQALNLYRAAGDAHGAAAALDGLGTAAFTLGEFESARGLYDQSLELRRELGDQHGKVISLLRAGELALEIGDLDAAQACLDESAAVGASLGRRWAMSAGSRAYGSLALARGDLREAQRLYEESMALNRESGNRREIALDLLALGAVAAEVGDEQRAKDHYHQSLALFRETGYRRGLAMALTGLGYQAALDSTEAEARDFFAEALGTALEIGAMPSAMAALVGLAGLSAASGRQAQAAEVLTYALYQAASSRATRDRAEQLLSALESKLPSDEVAAAEERGRHGRLEDLVALLAAA